MPGFRKASAAPPQLLINTVGVDKFRNSVAEHLLQATLEEALAPVEKNGFQGAPLLLCFVPLCVPRVLTRVLLRAQTRCAS